MNIKKILLRIRIYLFSLLDLFIRWLPICGEREGVVLVRVDAIGDFIIWLDSAKEFRKMYPNQHITLVGNSIWADFARQFSYWDDVVSVDCRKLVRNPFYRFLFFYKIRCARFQVAIHPGYSRVYLLGDSLVRATAAPERIGSMGDLSNISGHDKEVSDEWYTQLIKADSRLLMELERNAEFVRGLAGRPFEANISEIPESKTNDDCRLYGRYAVLFPGASWSGREWPINNFVDVAEELKEKYELNVVLCGSMQDRDRCMVIAREVGRGCIDLSGKTSLGQLVSVVRESIVLIGNETSAVHIAAAVGTPSICILGGGHYGRFMPYPESVKGQRPLFAVHYMPCFNCNWKCIYPITKSGAVRCIADVTVAQVSNLILDVFRVDSGRP